jgi:hypothetical protein
MVSLAHCQQLLPCSNLGGGTFFYPFYHFYPFLSYCRYKESKNLHNHFILVNNGVKKNSKDFEKVCDAHHHTLTYHAQFFVSLYEMWNLVRDVCYHILKII